MLDKKAKIGDRAPRRHGQKSSVVELRTMREKHFATLPESSHGDVAQPLILPRDLRSFVQITFDVAPNLIFEVLLTSTNSHRHHTRNKPRNPEH